MKQESFVLETERKLSNNKILNMSEEIAMLKKHKNELSELYSQYKEYMKQNSEALLNKFENFTAKTLEANSSKFTEFSRQKLDYLLSPLKYKIDDFHKQVNDYYNKELEGRSNLNAEVKLIATESKRLAESCNNLVHTLRGSQKLQGNWGELVLRKVLESSGLREGEEYYYQAQVRRKEENNKYSIVDVLINLPEDKHLVIDAKTSLKHYEAHQNTTNEEKKIFHLKDFLESIKNHIKNLSSKEYQQRNNISSPDFTIMFIPIDSAFILAIQNDNEIQNFALKNNVLLSSPSLLIAILKTVNSLWSMSKQNANAQRIALAAGDMYNKFCGFIDDMSKIGLSIDKAKNYYNDAFGKLYQGKGNLIKKATSIKEMGIMTKSDKNIPEDLIDSAAAEENLQIEEA
ncbi:MAG: DNA recombination protein RmuC [Rickettsiaceae bacterium H1]|nr:DNA recombination protein RmuC [Rickettsiaceae bacterium H1]